MVELLGPLPGECFRNKATKRIARDDATHAAICPAQDSEASHSKCFAHVCRYTRLREERGSGSFRQQLDGFAILKRGMQGILTQNRSTRTATFILLGAHRGLVTLVGEETTQGQHTDLRPCKAQQGNILPWHKPALLQGRNEDLNPPVPQDFLREWREGNRKILRTPTVKPTSAALFATRAAMSKWLRMKTFQAQVTCHTPHTKSRPTSNTQSPTRSLHTNATACSPIPLRCTLCVHPACSVRMPGAPPQRAERSVAAMARVVRWKVDAEGCQDRSRSEPPGDCARGHSVQPLVSRGQAST